MLAEGQGGVGRVGRAGAGGVIGAGDGEGQGGVVMQGPGPVAVTQAVAELHAAAFTRVQALMGAEGIRRHDEAVAAVTADLQAAPVAGLVSGGAGLPLNLGEGCGAG